MIEYNRHGIFFLTLSFVLFFNTMLLSGRDMNKSNQNSSLDNNFFDIHYDLDKGLFDCLSKEGQAFIDDAFVSLQLPETVINTTDSRFKRISKVQDFKNRIGSGKQLIIYGKDTNQTIDIELVISLYDDQDYFTLEATAINTSNQDLLIKAIHPLHVSAQSTGGINNYIA